MRTHTLSAILVLSLIASPMPVFSAGSVTADDTIAGLGAEIMLAGFTPSASYDVSILPPAGPAVTLRTMTDGSGNAHASLESAETERAGRYRVSVLKSGQTVQDGVTFDVLPESVDVRNSDVRSLQSFIEPDGNDEAEIAVTLYDRFGNALAGRPVTLISSRDGDALYPLSQETDATGTQRFLFSTREEGTAVLRAIDLLSGNTLSQSAQVQAGSARTAMGNASYEPAPSRTTSGQKYYYAGQVSSFDVIDHFEIDVPETMDAGIEAPKLTITAVDRNNQRVEDYIGTILFSSTDPDAELPNFGRYEFKDRDLGEKAFSLSLTFQSTGVQTLRVEDANDPGIFGEREITVNGRGGTTATIEITSHANGDVVGTRDIVLEGTGPRFANLEVKVMSGPASQEFTGSTDGDGQFSIAITLPEGNEFNILVREESGRGEAQPLFLTLDEVPPTIGKITFAPEEPAEGEKVLVVMESEANLEKATMTIKDPKTGAVQETVLQPVSSNPPTYQGFFTAPASGSYQPVFKAVDMAGNETEVRATNTVKASSLPTVTGLTAEPRVNAVALSWLGVEGDVDQYRVYVGESADDLANNFGTNRPTTKATIAGLKPGKTYFFAVTALQGDRESGELSDIIEARTLGLQLSVEEQDTSLLLTWSAPSPDLPLASYVLSYGISKDSMTETRELHGGLTAYTLRDLLNGVPYFLKLTPVTITGDLLSDMATEAIGTPNGDGYHAAASDPIPFDPATHPGGLHEGAPLTPSSGIPFLPWWAVATMAVLVCGFLWRRRSIARRSRGFLDAMEARYSA